MPPLSLDHIRRGTPEQPLLAEWAGRAGQGEDWFGQGGSVYESDWVKRSKAGMGGGPSPDWAAAGIGSRWNHLGSDWL